MLLEENMHLHDENEKLREELNELKRKTNNDAYNPPKKKRRYD